MSRSDEAPVTVSVRDGLFVAVLNRPAVRNAIDFATVEALDGVIADIEVDESIRAMLITGAGPVFASGGDLRLFSTMGSATEVREMSLRVQDTLRRLEAVPVPTVAAINGPAIGGGAELALACDTRVIGAGAYICFPQTSLGIITGWNGGQRLLKLVGYSRAAEILFGSERIPAEMALALGIVNAVLSEPFAQSAEAYARRLMGGARSANADMKRALLFGLRLPPDEAAEAETEMFVNRWLGPERAERMARVMRRMEPEM